MFVRAWELFSPEAADGGRLAVRDDHDHRSLSHRRRHVHMDSGAYRLLESATQRTLHAHAFSRSSSQASSVLTDLLSRYLALLTSTCAKYSQHAGRTGLTVRDAIGALNELGVDIDELSDYCATEGKELNRYALYSTRRAEDLHEFSCTFILVLSSLCLTGFSPTCRGTASGPR